MCHSLAGNGRLGAFQRTRLFFLASYGKKKIRRVREELRVTLYVPFFFFKSNFLRAKLVSKYVIIGM